MEVRLTLVEGVDTPGFIQDMGQRVSNSDRVFDTLLREMISRGSGIGYSVDTESK